MEWRITKDTIARDNPVFFIINISCTKSGITWIHSLYTHRSWLVLSLGPGGIVAVPTAGLNKYWPRKWAGGVYLLTNGSNTTAHRYIYIYIIIEIYIPQLNSLAQVMACCLTAPSHYLNQCWLISKVEWHSSKGKFTTNTEIICEIKYLKFHSNFPGANELIHWLFNNNMIASVPVE